MAETAKILNPGKKVLIADESAGCSLADKFTAENVREYRRLYPGSPVVTYINSYASVKAESDFCCTSANALRVVRYAAQEFGVRRVIFLPDTLMAENLENEFERRAEAIELIYPGKYDSKRTQCEVHEQFTADHLIEVRLQYHMKKSESDCAILVHWECAPEVLKEADFYGSTSEMGQYIADRPQLRRVYLATECEMSANLATEFPNVEFIRSCGVHCPHMRKINLLKLRNCLRDETPEVHVDMELATRARQAIDRMLAIL
ncbi:MAG: quinolinate synthase [Deltaproteobacteria bacterium CG11_big_fil_rev_8_21_14_0_20_45_16]|nr:MAG: quinolinate synthase [Deltaproteobacteria bacterium CG11_big_fil_rev_8_21_14_0_20_45_16]